MTRRALIRLATFVAAIATAGVHAGAQQSSSADVSLDSLLNVSISAASKYAQTSSAAPGSVTIVSSDEIRSYGYRNLQEVLENVRGFYMSNDRNYPHLGVRGFSRTSDYNSRVLVLIDGHALNDDLWGTAPVGADLPLDLDVVERIEIVQGPGSAMYGTGAMFAVINIVTKSANALNGTAARTEIGSLGERTLGLTTGHAFGSGVSVTGSGLPRSALSRLGNAEIGLRVTNLFDVAYATPAGDGSRQDAIAADGRTLVLHLEWQF